jgi:hypothetical protein
MQPLLEKVTCLRLNGSVEGRRRGRNVKNNRPELMERVGLESIH